MRPGDVLADRFEIERLAVSGGMGAVFRARDRQRGEAVAVKTLYRKSPEDTERFVREAELLAALSHPGIVRHIAHGKSPEDELYLVMEWLDGEDLAARLKRTGALSVEESLAVAGEVARALGAAHARGVVHRDVKPSNVFLVGGAVDRVRILDFGIARLGDTMRGGHRPGLRSGEPSSAPGPARGTRTNVMGTPGYMAPEQARGDPNVDARADVFALGCVLFECLTGRVVFVGSHPMAVLAKILLEPPPRLRDLRPHMPRELDALLARMLASDPAARPRDGAALLAELAEIGGGAPSEAAERSRPRWSVAPPASITDGEQRALSVILAGVPRGRAQPEAATLAVPDPSETAALAALVEAHGGRLEPLADGSLVVTITGAARPVRPTATLSDDPASSVARRAAARSATDLAAQAARCALSLLSLLPDVPLALATGRGRHAEGRWPVGEAIDRAARLLHAAADPAAGAGHRPGLRADEPPSAPGPATAPGVRIDEVTAGLLDVRFDVRGGPAGLELYGERDVAEGSRTLLGKPTPCVGREREIAALAGLFEQCVAEPVARAALIVAPAGAGKSRLRDELLRAVRRRGDPVEVWLGRGDPLSAGSPFGMIAPALRRAAGVLDGEPLEVRRRKIAARAARHLRGPELPRVTWFLGELTGAPFPDDTSVELRAARQDPMLMGDQMRRAFEDFLAADARAQPVLVVLDDLHWGDLPSVKFIDAALRNLPDLPWMVLGAGRPEVSDLFPGLWQAHGVEEIRLGQLTKRSAERLARAVLGPGAAAEVVDAIVERSAGNAFYLEELIRAVAEGKGAALPETVITMAESRLEDLDPDERRVLRAASVFGQVAWRGGLLALLEASTAPDHLDALVADLARRELVTLRGEGKFPGEPEVIFRHALFREAAYAMLTDEDRALGHRLAGEWLLAAGEGEAIVLGEHFERGGEPGAAVAWYRRAAEQALGGNDLAAAVARAERGVACGASGEVLGALRWIQEEAEIWRGDNAAGLRLGLAAMEALPPGSADWCRAAGQCAAAAGRLGDHERLAQLCSALVAHAAAAGGSTSYVIACARAALSAHVLGRPDGTEPLLAVLDHARPMDPVALAWLERAAALRAFLDGDFGVYLRHSEEAADRFAESGDVRMATLQRVNSGHAYLVLGAFAEAERALRDVIACAAPLGLMIVIANAQHNLGMALARTGALDQAREVEAQAERAFHLQGDRRLEAGSRMYLAVIDLLAGDLDAAERAAEAAVEMAGDHPGVRAHALATLAEVKLARGRAAEAAPLAAEAMSIVDRGAADDAETEARLIHAEALDRTGDRAAARAAVAAARDRLLARAARIGDDALRASFLDRVPENRRTMDLAAAWLDGAG
jgi:tetratricopeptide (TPR) repeat protein